MPRQGTRPRLMTAVRVWMLVVIDKEGLSGTCSVPSSRRIGTLLKLSPWFSNFQELAKLAANNRLVSR